MARRASCSEVSRSTKLLWCVAIAAIRGLGELDSAAVRMVCADGGGHSSFRDGFHASILSTLSRARGGSWSCAQTKPCLFKLRKKLCWLALNIWSQRWLRRTHHPDRDRKSLHRRLRAIIQVLGKSSLLCFIFLDVTDVVLVAVREVVVVTLLGVAVGGGIQ